MASKLQHFVSKASIKGAVNTVSLLLMFLLSVAVFTFGSLYFELRYKHQLLVDEVAQLKDSQILFMVPDEQAEVMAKWMADNPVVVQSFAERARKGEITTMPIGDGSVELDIGAVAVNTAKVQVSLLDMAKQIVPAVTANANSESVDESRKVVTNMETDSAANLPVSNVAVTEASAEIKALPVLVNTAVAADSATVKINGSPPQLVSNEANNSEAEVMLDDAMLTIPAKAQMVTVTEDGVKLISLPHGGIRITTRALEE
jgi:hypothetical protein